MIDFAIADTFPFSSSLNPKCGGGKKDDIEDLVMIGQRQPQLRANNI